MRPCVVQAHFVYSTSCLLYTSGKGARGDFGPFMAPQASAKVMYDEAFVRELEQLWEEADFPMGTEGEKEKELDHGTLVPLFFINQYYRDYKLSLIHI